MPRWSCDELKLTKGIVGHIIVFLVLMAPIPSLAGGIHVSGRNVRGAIAIVHTTI